MEGDAEQQRAGAFDVKRAQQPARAVEHDDVAGAGRLAYVEVGDVEVALLVGGDPLRVRGADGQRREGGRGTPDLGLSLQRAGGEQRQQRALERARERHVLSPWGLCRRLRRRRQHRLKRPYTTPPAPEQSLTRLRATPVASTPSKRQFRS